MIILASIISGLPSAIGGTLELANTGEISSALVLILLILVVAVTSFVVFVERGQRRIPVNYAKRQQGRRMMQGQSTHLPFKINMSGVIPPIFASSIILFPATIASWFGTSEGFDWLQDIRCKFGTWTADLYSTLCWFDYVFLLFIHLWYLILKIPPITCRGLVLLCLELDQEDKLQNI